MVVGVDLPVNNVKKFFVAMEQQRCVPSAILSSYRGADKSLARPGRKQATATKL